MARVADHLRAGPVVVGRSPRDRSMKGNVCSGAQLVPYGLADEGPESALLWRRTAFVEGGGGALGLQHEGESSRFETSI
jgi:hypothetical protein